jgi:serine/threonine protein kinase
MLAQHGGDDGGVVVDGSNRPQPTDVQTDVASGTSPTAATQANAPALTPDTVLDGRYRLMTPVSSRGPVTLWRGDDEVLARAVAVRVVEHPDGVDPERGRVARILLDAAIGSGRLVHPGAASTYDATTTTAEIGAVSYVVSEWVDGRTLRQLAVGGNMPPGQAASVVLAAARVVAAAHERGIHHGDLDPGNVIVSPHGTVKVIDIQTGGVLAAIEASRPDGDPAPGGGGGGGGDRDPRRADVEALGGLLYAALTGMWPLGGDVGLPGAPSAGGRLRTPRQVRSGVPRDLDAVTMATLCDPRTAGSEITTAPELVAELDAIAPGDAVFDPGLVSFDATGSAAVAGGGTGVGTREMPAAYGPSDTAYGPAGTAYRPAETAYGRPETAYGRPAAGGSPPGGYPPMQHPDAPHLDDLRPPSRGGYGPPQRRAGGRAGSAPGRRRLPWAVGGMLSILVLAAVLALTLPTSGDDGATPSPSSSPTSVPPGANLKPTGIASYDPQSADADKTEKEGRVGNVLDGDPATTWETEGYNQNMGPGGIKAGVGFRLEFAQAVTPREVKITFANGPTSFQLLAGDAATYDVSRYRPAASAEAVSGTRTVPVRADAAHRYWVVWLTHLPTVGGKFKGTVVDVTLRS